MAQPGQIDLLSLFKKASKSLAQNKDSLNQADSYNHDHGDHMVEIFEVITQAMKQKKTAQPADQLEYAAQLLREKSTSGSGKLYAQNLEKAAKDIVGKEVNVGTVMTILQSLMGAKNEAAKPAGGDMLASLLGQLGGSGEGQVGQGIDLGDILNVGMQVMSAKNEGKGGLEALTGALLSGSQMAESDYRSQSGEIVTQALLGALGSMMKK